MIRLGNPEGAEAENSIGFQYSQLHFKVIDTVWRVPSLGLPTPSATSSVWASLAPSFTANRLPFQIEQKFMLTFFDVVRIGGQANHTFFLKISFMPKSPPDDPNSHLSAETIKDGLSIGVRVFNTYTYKIPYYAPQGYENHAIVAADMAGIKFVLYVRITQDQETLHGVGQPPPILEAAARELNALPLLVHVHLTEGKESTFGFEEVEDTIKSQEPNYTRHVLEGREVNDFLPLCGWNKSRLDVSVIESGIDEKTGRKEFKLDLSVDDERLTFAARCLHPFALAGSLRWSGLYDLLTCECGYLACGGEERGVTVAHEGSFTLWQNYRFPGVDACVFDRLEYRTKMGAALLDLCHRCEADRQSPEADPRNYVADFKKLLARVGIAP
jgi:hypothetical protein